MKCVVAIVLAMMLIPALAFSQEGEQFATLLGNHLGNGTLADVEAKLGKSTLVETGDAGDYKAAICYYVSKCRTKVEFSSGELDGPDHELSGFTLTRESRKSDQCPELRLKDCSELSVSDLHLGMSLYDYKKKVGDDVVSEGGFFKKTYERREPMTENECLAIESVTPPDQMYWDISVVIRAAFRTKTLEILQVSKTASY